jgi:hypothetical protein
VPPNLARSQAKIEDLPSDGGRVVDTLAGAILRVFARLNEIERAYNDLRVRVGVLEDRTPVRPAPANDSRRTMSDGRPDTRGSNPVSRLAAPGAGAISGRLVELGKLKPDRAAQEADRPKGEGGHGQPPV